MAVVSPSLRLCFVAVALALWFCSSVALAAGTPDSLRTDFQRTHQFKVAVNLARRTGPGVDGHELRLFASGDRGRSWQFVQAASLKTTAFAVTVPSDGEYLFAVRLAQPSDDKKAGAEHTATYRAIVDSEPPQITVSAKRAASGEIVATWRATDKWIDEGSFKLSAGREGELLPVAAQPNVSAGPGAIAGSVSWWPTHTSGTVAVRAEVTDRAGNPKVAMTQIQLTNSPIDERTAPPPPGPEATDAVATREPGLPAREVSSPIESAADAPAVVGPFERAGPPVTQFGGPPQTNTDGPQSWPADERSTQSFERKTEAGRNDPAKPPEIFQPSNAPIEELPSASEVRPPVTGQVKPEGGEPRGATSAPAATLPLGERPKVVGTKRVSLNYDVDGPASERAEVELWSTTDGGRTWTTHGIDPDMRSPFVTTLAGEGLYGFRITVNRARAAAMRRPLSGDAPDLWVVLDQTKPLGAITAADVRNGAAGRELAIRYEAADVRLAQRPVNLFYSEQPDGPWKTIAVGLAATGGYTWALDDRMPGTVYLRMEVQDEAGNVGAFETASPVRLEEAQASGQVLGVDSPKDGTARQSWPRRG